MAPRGPGKASGLLPMRLLLSTAAVLAALSSPLRADFQASIVPTYAGSSAAQYAYWGGSPGNPFTGFTHAFGAPNAPNDPASDLAATITQWTPGALITSTGNIYGASGALSFELRAALPHAARIVTLQFRTLGSPIDVNYVQLALGDGTQTITAPAATPQLLLQVASGFVIEEWLLQWDVTALPIEATELVLTFDATAANCSFDDARLDVLHDGPLGTNSCAAAPNSTGLPGEIRAHGDDRAAANALRLRASQLPPNAAGYFLTSRTTGFIANPGGSQGNLCLGGAIGRYSGSVLHSSPAGRFELQLDLTYVPLPTGAVPAQAGETWHFQAWYRDANPSVTSNFTDATAVTLR
jgi:hypothetical protein